MKYGNDHRLAREIETVIYEFGLPAEDADEIARARLGRPVPSLRRTRRFEAPPQLTYADRPVMRHPPQAPKQQGPRDLTLRLGGCTKNVHVER